MSNMEMKKTGGWQNAPPPERMKLMVQINDLGCIAHLTIDGLTILGTHSHEVSLRAESLQSFERVDLLISGRMLQTRSMSNSLGSSSSRLPEVVTGWLSP